MLDPMGSMEDTDGDGTRPHGISYGFPAVFIFSENSHPIIWELSSISFLQSTFEGRNTSRFIVIGEGSGTIPNPIQGQVRLIFPSVSKSLALLF